MATMTTADVFALRKELEFEKTNQALGKLVDVEAVIGVAETALDMLQARIAEEESRRTKMILERNDEYEELRRQAQRAIDVLSAAI